MELRDLTPAELADLLDSAYRADRGDGDVDAPGLDVRVALADLLGCHADLRDATWDAWRDELMQAEERVDDAEYWLDVEFIQPCPEDRPAPF
ncbi:hypothetical protein LAJ19_20610 (plasmid) [Deinococcus taeanensis]|uniref:hypothetical protein n=1 Tax=Deinococcus taeanensis TaxID=2737050 RepID=UPI001CDBC10D|nr:hypothetical protein [Deinococcus taeanensis]UBV45210.1 hypothetical protein LAJ19_20610 [Deinococcus taeanensis]